ncbi:hypothetical protein J6590_033885 [Homalodisca vitripennis]|nr:hypothetical protein J6590_033885 [Homalodisca vitripennis]
MPIMVWCGRTRNKMATNICSRGDNRGVRHDTLLAVWEKYHTAASAWDLLNNCTTLSAGSFRRFVPEIH